MLTVILALLALSVPAQTFPAAAQTFPAAAQTSPAAVQARITIVAAENFYGDVAQQIAGDGAAVSSILNNPDQDPHLFEASPSVARQLAGAAIAICNGADYDPWMTRLLAATKAPGRIVIVAADLVHRKAGDNPHLWYDPPTMPAVARALSVALAERDPAHKADYDARLASFLESLRPVQAKIAELRQRFAGTAVTATEPVFGYMAAALGLTMRNERFQLAVMNDTEPRASDVAAFETDLRRHSVRLLLYNSQATDAAARRLLRIAGQAKVPTVGVTETAPIGRHYQDWMLDQLDAVARALAAAPP
ncbi:MAG: zinc ABC transporter substrate-binding protein [Acetobacteraceae bacterium]